MFPQVSPSLFALDFASLATIAFCAPFVFMVLRIAFAATPLDSHLYKLPGGVGVKQANRRPSAWQVAAYPAGCHNSPLHTKRLAMRVSLARRLPLLILGATTGCPP